MSRLASFRGPSTPSKAPVHAKKFNSPSSPPRSTESTFHRKIRIHLEELRAVSETWDDLVLIDGVKAAKGLVDTRTDLENEIALFPDKQPRSAFIGPRLIAMEKHIAELDLVIVKLQRQFRKMNSIIDDMETIMAEAHRTKGWQFVHEEPLWVTWPMERFVTHVSSILAPYHRSLMLHIELVNILKGHSVPFEDSRTAISKWVAQPYLESASWNAQWEDICGVEVEGWDN